MSIDFSQYSIEQLDQFVVEINKEIQNKKNQKRKSLMADLERLARDAGISLDELLDQSSIRKAPKAKGAVAVKYRNPNDASQTWTGRGRQPLWIAALLAEGRTLESLAI